MTEQTNNNGYKIGDTTTLTEETVIRSSSSHRTFPEGIELKIVRLSTWVKSSDFVVVEGLMDDGELGQFTTSWTRLLKETTN